ncbi:RNA polymerase II elongation factor Ell [Pseudolycoriella hygida]|uniref:RNA polymerase II elongation factor Ell n=1 Tax=Pseudolycoriella hygida TaxID=35572 RepID=A0A9Q0S839_9DIPT|nr:RNA polymerase II elongation factor Ell [Pseudolycoriella hygida]
MNKQSSKATIQFLGNQGYLSFPSVTNNNGGQKFSFSIVQRDWIQGSFDCIQQNQNQQLDVLGTMTHKMRIHANEDVYEATRHRMAAVEETQKNKCTREIKPNQTDIGRKVKVKHAVNRLSNIPNSNTINKRDSSAPSNSINTFINNSPTVTQSLRNNIINIQHQNSLRTFSPSPTPINTSSPLMTNNSYSQSSVGLPMSTSATSRTVPKRANNRNSSARPTSEVSKRPIKERLIHLLAVRPYKKPELWSKISNEGVREKDKLNMSLHLRSIASMKGNTFYLNRHVWNDVQEDWPYYTEQDRQTLKRKKPQNLTPPLSSDGGSGQSPSSTHNGSPPPAVKRPSLNNDKYSSEPPSKKQRISHFKKDFPTNDNNRRNVLDSRDSCNLNPRSREYDVIQMRSSSHYGSNVLPTAMSEDNISSLNFTVLNTEAAKRISSTSASMSDHDHEMDINDEQSKLMGQQAINKPIEATTYEFSFSEYSKITSMEQRRQYKKDFEKDFFEYKELFQDRQLITERFTDLESQLRQVTNNEQQHRVGSSSTSPEALKKDIQRKIIAEFQRTISDSQRQQHEERFQYLHQKLSRIKNLIQEYDASLPIPGREVEQENY